MKPQLHNRNCFSALHACLNFVLVNINCDFFRIILLKFDFYFYLDMFFFTLDSKGIVQCIKERNPVYPKPLNLSSLLRLSKKKLNISGS